MSSILTGSTIFSALTPIKGRRGAVRRGQLKQASGVPVPERLFPKSAFDSSCHGITEPDNGSKKDDGKHKKYSVNHDSTP